MVNGRLDTRKLASLVNFHPIDPHAGGLALPEVARQWKALVRDCKRDTGIDVTASEGYRDVETQEYWKAWWTNQGKPQNAAEPGTSPHGEGLAIDAGSGAGTYGSTVDVWLTNHAEEYGFIRPFLTGRVIERWHLLYVGGAKIIYEMVEKMAKVSDPWFKVRVLRNKSTDKIAIASIATGFWYEVPSPAYLNILPDHFGKLPETETLAANRWKFLKSLARMRK
ncbi:putative peptidase [Curtobacterium phage Reje]|uniref:putative peptidase n=1 Tax=Curtobacterium phage Reje TaxID=2851069 RepID=UPI002209DA7E|nr:putative peptidase [Curtobacterium phage Reje]QXG07819.1 putative peptidase [Curtobacterium phage Reje]